MTIATQAIGKGARLRKRVRRKSYRKPRGMKSGTFGKHPR